MEKLNELLQMGFISQEEYEARKRDLLLTTAPNEPEAKETKDGGDEGGGDDAFLLEEYCANCEKYAL